jgi:diguanylate cyclase (GGDEF)-like protein
VRYADPSNAPTQLAATAPEGPALPVGLLVRMLEQVIVVQRAAVRRASLREVFDAVTAGAQKLLGDEIVGLRLRDRTDPSMLQVVSAHGLPEGVAWLLWRTPTDASGASGQAVLRDEVVVLDGYADSQAGIREVAEFGVCAAMAAPVHDNGEVIGSLVVASRRPGRAYTADDRELLAVFAEHVGVAIADAQALDGLEQAFRDPLTGLASRALFNDRLAHALACAERDRTRTSVLVVDLDRFRTVNDSLGHATGDLVLAAVGQRLRGCVRASDTVARIGADEFGILLHDVELRDRAVTVADRVLRALHEPFPINDRDLVVGASIGIAFGAAGHQDAETLLQYADLALRAAKHNGKGRFEVFEPVMHAAVKKGTELETDLRQAVAHEQFVLRYQPIVELHSGRITGFEALVRWDHPKLGMVPPLDFIPLAEETGLIVPIGTWVLREACRQTADWNRRRPDTTPLSISVNLSARQLQQPDLPQLVADILSSTGLADGCLTLEITESLLVHDIDATVSRLEHLRALGVRLAIDDFGTGYSSLAYLRRFPIDILKIDKLFVDAVATETPDASLTGAIVHLARTLHLSTVAEGIETYEQCGPLQDSGCQLGQGYYFAKPLTSTDAETLLFNQPGRPNDTAADQRPSR